MKTPRFPVDGKLIIRVYKVGAKLSGKTVISHGLHFLLLGNSGNDTRKRGYSAEHAAENL